MRHFLLLLGFWVVLTGTASAQDASCSADGLTAIYDIQGDDRRSPFVSEVVKTQGVVTGVFLGRDKLDGLFMQAPVGDGDSSTSDGIFLKISSRSDYADLEYQVGDLIQVEAKVIERNEMTQLDRIVNLTNCGSGQEIMPRLLLLHIANENLEQYEGMLVRFSGEMTVSESYNLGRYGELVLSSLGRLYQPQNSQKNAIENSLRRLILHDGSTVENPEPIPYTGENPVRLGYTVRSPTGVLSSYGLSAYRLEPTEEIIFEASNPRQAKPDEVGGTLKVAGFNVLNYFTTLKERGADSELEFQRQEQKLVASFVAMDADIVGLIEIENNGDEALQSIVDAINSELGDDVYSFMPDPATGVGSDAIRQALIYKADKVSVIDSFSDGSTVHDRPVVAGTFETPDGEVLTVIVTHGKSKGGCPAAGDVDTGQGCWNLRRSAQAQAIVDFAGDIVAEVGDADVLVVGDLNSYNQEDPIQIMKAASFENLEERLPLEDQYSYVFAAELGTLDYAFASPSLSAQVTGYDVWHINSDESRIYDYNLEYNPEYLYELSPFRSSDHDPVIVGVELK